jgi:hypothetical protein
MSATSGGSPGQSVPGAEAILATTYRQVIDFAHQRAGRGDLVAHRLSLELRSAGPVPPLAVVRRWLANVAAGSRVYVDPVMATRLMADMTARERLAPAAAERIWQEAVSAAR